MSEMSSTQAEDTGNSELEALQAKIDELTGENESIKGHMQKLLDETKSAKAKAQEAREKAKKEAELKTAKEKGDLEELVKAYERQLQEKNSEFEELNNKITKEKIYNKALELANSVSSGGKAKLLAKELEARLTIRDGEIRVVSDKGELMIDAPSKLIDSMKANEDYKFLFDAPKASGGGAPGNTSNSVASNTKTSTEVAAMNDAQKMQWALAGGVVQD